jgi:hypothetical protein
MKPQGRDDFFLMIRVRKTAGEIVQCGLLKQFEPILTMFPYPIISRLMDVHLMRLLSSVFSHPFETEFDAHDLLNEEVVANYVMLRFGNSGNREQDCLSMKLISKVFTPSSLHIMVEQHGL